MLLNIIAKAPYGDLKNTPDKPLFDMSNLPGIDKADSFFKTLDKFNENCSTIISFIGKFINAIMHPSIVFKFIYNKAGIICVVIVCAGIIIYAIGYKKAGKWVQGAIAGYIIIRMLGMVIL